MMNGAWITFVAEFKVERALFEQILSFYFRNNIQNGTVELCFTDKEPPTRAFGRGNVIFGCELLQYLGKE